MPRQEILFSLALKDNFDPPQGGWADFWVDKRLACLQDSALRVYQVERQTFPGQPCGLRTRTLTAD